MYTHNITFSPGVYYWCCCCNFMGGGGVWTRRRNIGGKRQKSIRNIPPACPSLIRVLRIFFSVWTENRILKISRTRNNNNNNKNRQRSYAMTGHFGVSILYYIYWRFDISNRIFSTFRSWNERYFEWSSYTHFILNYYIYFFLTKVDKNLLSLKPFIKKIINYIHGHVCWHFSIHMLTFHLLRWLDNDSV